MKLYPVPAGDFINIDLPENIKINNYSVFNSLGCQVLTGKIAGENRIDISSLQNGMYYIRMILDQIIYSGKISGD